MTSKLVTNTTRHHHSSKYRHNGAPKDVPSLVSRLVDSACWERQCALFFPEEDGHMSGVARRVDVDDANAHTGGWNRVNTMRLA